MGRVKSCVRKGEAPNAKHKIQSVFVFILVTFGVSKYPFCFGMGSFVVSAKVWEKIVL
jgi:hypothetical protein